MIIKSLLDTDFYKFTMGQFVWRNFPNIQVKYAFKCRNKNIKLAEWIDFRELHNELESLRTLRFQNDELRFLLLQGFDRNYLNFLRDYKLPPYRLDIIDGNLILEFAGKWSEAIYWETFALSVINELLCKNQICVNGEKEGHDRLNRKISYLKLNSDIKFMEFGTRRRYSREWQNEVFVKLQEEIPTQIIGTSNVYLAKRCGTKPLGTMAHELFMIAAGIEHAKRGDVVNNIRKSHEQILEKWFREYGEKYSIALTDTFGSNFFFENVPPIIFQKWRGLRQDSGDPFSFGEKAIECYEKNGIDPKTKVIVFSDGLDINAMIALNNTFKNRIQIIFGWGTNLTNDRGPNTLSLVVKPIMASGYGLVKLSDNISKATGLREDIELYKRIFGYDTNFNLECRY